MTKIELTERIAAAVGFVGVVGIASIDVPGVNEFSENLATAIFAGLAVMDTARRFFQK